LCCEPVLRKEAGVRSHFYYSNVGSHETDDEAATAVTQLQGFTGLCLMPHSTEYKVVL